MINRFLMLLAAAYTYVCTLVGATSVNCSDECTDPCTATVRIRLLRAGTWDTLGGGGSGSWITGDCVAADIGDSYEAEMVINTGDNPTSGTAFGAATWTTINTTLDWTWTTTVAGGLDATFTLTVREIADTANSVTFTGSMHTLVE